MDNFWFDFMDNQTLFDKVFDFVSNKVGKDSPKMAEQLSKLMERKVDLLPVSSSFLFPLELSFLGWFFQRRGSGHITIQRKDNQPKPYLPRKYLSLFSLSSFSFLWALNFPLLSSAYSKRAAI